MRQSIVTIVIYDFENRIFLAKFIRLCHPIPFLFLLPGMRWISVFLPRFDCFVCLCMFVLIDRQTQLLCVHILPYRFRWLDSFKCRIAIRFDKSRRKWQQHKLKQNRLHSSTFKTRQKRIFFFVPLMLCYYCWGNDYFKYNDNNNGGRRRGMGKGLYVNRCNIMDKIKE